MRLWLRSWFIEAPPSRQNKAYFALFFVLINIVFVGLVSPWFVVRWDAFDYWLPRLHWMGDALRGGYFPDYLPYIFSGYSLGGDMQAGVYNPLYLFAAVVFADSAFSATFLYLFFLSAIYLTCYRLGLSIFKFRLTAFYAALSVVVCGAVLPHSQHFSFLASYVGFLGLSAALVDLSEEKWRRGWWLTFLSTWFLLTSGYATLILSAVLVLSVVALWLSFRRVKNQARFWILAITGVLLGVALAWPALAHFLAVLPLTDRGDGQTLAVVSSGSLPWVSLLGFFAPFVTIKPGTLDLTMAQLNVLISTPFLLIYGWRSQAAQKGKWILTFSAVLLIALCMGAYFPIPIRMWLAESLQIFRSGRFPCAEFKLYALMILIYFAARGFEELHRRLSKTNQKKLLVALTLDVLLIFIIKRRFVLQSVESVFLAPMKLEFSSKDQALLDQKRDCPEDRKTIVIGNTSKAPFFGENRFSAQGFSPMSLKKYVEDFSQVAWAVCEAGRLFSPLTQQAVPYELISYTPRAVHFRFAPNAEDEMYLWSETLDPYWNLKINGQASSFIEGPGHLRYFQVPRSALPVEIEMSYRGPISQFL